MIKQWIDLAAFGRPSLPNLCFGTMSAYSRYMDGDLKESGVQAVVEGVSSISEAAVTPTALDTAIEASQQIGAALQEGTPPHEILEAHANGLFGGDSLQEVDEQMPDTHDNGLQSHLDNVDVVIDGSADAPDSEHANSTDTPDTDTTGAKQTKEETTDDHPEVEPDEDDTADDEPIQNARSEDEIAMSEAIAKARAALQKIKEDLLVIKAAMDMIPGGLSKQEREEKLTMLKIKDRFVAIKNSTDTFSADILLQEEQFLDSQDFHKYILAFDALKADGEKARRDAAIAYRKTFNLRPDIQSALPRHWNDVLRAPFRSAIDSAAVKMGWSQEVDTLFSLTDKEKESILEAHKEAMKETNKHRKEQLLEMGIMGLMMSLHEVEQMAHEAKQKAEHDMRAA